MKKGGAYEGYCVELLDRLTTQLGVLGFPFKYELRLVRDNKYGAQLVDESWNGMIGELIRKVSLSSCSL